MRQPKYSHPVGREGMLADRVGCTKKIRAERVVRIMWTVAEDGEAMRVSGK